MTLNSLARKCCYTALATSVVLFLCITSATAEDSDRETIQKLVQDSQRAGHKQRDFDKYMSLWTEDAKLIVGRSEEPGMHDWTIDRKQVEATAKLKYRAPPDKELKIEYENTEVQIDGDKATLTHQVTFLKSEYLEVSQEVYLLRRTPDGWKAYENRWWPIKRGDPKKPIEYTEDFWKRADRLVEHEVNEESHIGQFSSLMMSYRFPEALEVATRLTEDSPKDAEAWLARGYAAIMSCEAEVAEKSFREALQLDPESNVPEYMRIKSDSTSE